MASNLSIKVLRVACNERMHESQQGPLMETPQRFRPHPQVVHQTVEEEAILIHMGTGSYYSLLGAASASWEMLTGGCSSAELAARLREVCSGCPAGLDQEVAAFLEELQRENLVVEGEGTGAFPTPSSIVYSPLTAQKFTDMQDLLLADPIHEVGEAGWPLLPPGVRA